MSKGRKSCNISMKSTIGIPRWRGRKFEEFHYFRWNRQFEPPIKRLKSRWLKKIQYIPWNWSFGGESKILTTFQHKLNHKFVNSTIILKYIQRKKQLDNFFIFLKDIQSKNNEYIDDVSPCKQPELLIFKGYSK